MSDEKKEDKKNIIIGSIVGSVMVALAGVGSFLLQSEVENECKDAEVIIPITEDLTWCGTEEEATQVKTAIKDKLDDGDLPITVMKAWIKEDESYRKLLKEDLRQRKDKIHLQPLQIEIAKQEEDYYQELRDFIKDSYKKSHGNTNNPVMALEPHTVKIAEYILNVEYDKFTDGTRTINQEKAKLLPSHREITKDGKPYYIFTVNNAFHDLLFNL